MGRALDWDCDGPTWPHHAHSHRIAVAGLHWHVQRFEAPRADAPCALLLHGTGASTHSWRTLAPLLALHMRVLAIDLPGHAFTGVPAVGARAPQLSLPGMAKAVHQLLQSMDEVPALMVGHSAGAALAVRMAIDGFVRPTLMVGLNAALLPLGGAAGPVFASAAKMMARLPLVPRLFAHHASEHAVVRRLLQTTGSTLDAEGTELYRRLVACPRHVAGALGMMAQWDLHTLARDLPRLSTPLLLLVGERDHTVPPPQAQRVIARLSVATLGQCITLPGLGHLAHEEKATLVATHIIEAWQTLVAEHR